MLTSRSELDNPGNARLALTNYSSRNTSLQDLQLPSTESASSSQHHSRTLPFQTVEEP